MTHSGKGPWAPEPHRGKERPKTAHELALKMGELRNPQAWRDQRTDTGRGTPAGTGQERASENTNRRNRTAPKDRQKAKDDGSLTDRQTAADSLSEGLGERNPRKKTTRAANHKTRAVGLSSQGGSQLRASDAEAHKLGVGPDVWPRIQSYWAGTHDTNEETILVG